MLRRSAQKLREQQRKTTYASPNLSNSRQMLHCTSLQNLRVPSDKNAIEQTFKKKSPVYVSGFNQSNLNCLEKSPSRAEEQFSSSKSHLNLLSFNNYIKLQNHAQRDIDKYVNSFRASLQRSQTGSNSRMKNSKIKEVKKNEQKEFIKTSEKKELKKVVLGSPNSKRPQRFIRKNADSVIVSPPKNEVDEHFCFSQKNLQELVHRVNEEKQKNEKQLKLKIEYLQKIQIKAQNRVQKLTSELTLLRREEASKTRTIEKLQKEVENLSTQNQGLQKKIDQLCEESNMILKDIVFNPSEFCTEHNQSNTSVIAFDMTQTAEYISNISDLEEQISRKNIEIFELSKKMQEMKIKEHCNKLKHQNELQSLETRWKDKYLSMSERYRNLKAQFTQYRNRQKYKSHSQIKQRRHYEEPGNQIQKQSFFNLSMSMQQ